MPDRQDQEWGNWRREPLTELHVKLEGLVVSVREMNERIGGRLDEIIDDQHKSYVTHEEFDLVKKIVYGAAGTILLAVLVTLLYMIGLKKG